MPAGPLPLKAIHHVELLVGNAKQAAYYFRHAFGFAGPETGVREQASYVPYQGGIRFGWWSARRRIPAYRVRRQPAPAWSESTLSSAMSRAAE